MCKSTEYGHSVARIQHKHTTDTAKTIVTIAPDSKRFGENALN